MSLKAHATISRQILEEASEWFVEFRTGDIDAGGRQRFNLWLRRSPEHIQAYLEITSIWTELPAITAAREFDVEQLIARACAGADIVPIARATGSARAPRGSARRLLLAASICVVLGAVLFGLAVLSRDQRYTSETGEQRWISLSDGSSVDLNARSRIEVHFSRGERDVRLLEGQALFQVAKDKHRPFVVSSGGTLVRAVGTQFDVNRKQAGTVVTVLEGRVAVATDERSSRRASGRGPRAGAPSQSPALPEVYVSAGEQLTIDATAPVQPRHADVAAATAWTRRELIFDATPLAEVVNEFNRYNTRQLVVDGARLQGLKISGVYASTDPASLLRFLRDQPGFVVTELDTEVRISQRLAR